MPIVVDPLEWTLARQSDDGSWDPGADVSRTELTATVAIYLMVTGRVPGQDEPLDRALAWLSDRVDESDGRVLDPTIGYERRAHATAALAFTEAAALNPAPNRKRRAQRTGAHLVRDVAGDAFQRVGADRATEVAAATWAAMALRSGAMGGSDVTVAELERARANLRAFFGDSSDVAFDDRSVAMLACADVLLGADPSKDERLRRGIDTLLERTSGGLVDDPRLAYFGTFATFQVGGEAWETWRERLRESPVPLAGGSDDPSVHAVVMRAIADAMVQRFDGVSGPR